MDRIPGAASVRTRLAAFLNLVGQRRLSSLASQASVKVASLSTLDLAGVMIKAPTRVTELSQSAAVNLPAVGKGNWLTSAV